jgi:2-C-methyl-D-erythritol 4-phosphate cytidylyltransferase
MYGISKILVPINGLPLIGHTLRNLEACGSIDEIIVVTREEDISAIAALPGKLGLSKISKILKGGETRTLSVMIGLMETKAELVAIHDGARPCVSPELCDALIAKAWETRAAIPAIPLIDSIKVGIQNDAKRDSAGELPLNALFVKKSLDRSALFAAQTPQCFDTGLVKGAIARVLRDGLEATDDAAAVEALPYPVNILPGERQNIKVTTADDLIIVSALLKESTL